MYCACESDWWWLFRWGPLSALGSCTEQHRETGHVPTKVTEYLQCRASGLEENVFCDSVDFIVCIPQQHTFSHQETVETAELYCSTGALCLWTVLKVQVRIISMDLCSVLLCGWAFTGWGGKQAGRSLVITTSTANAWSFMDGCILGRPWLYRTDKNDHAPAVQDGLCVAVQLRQMKSGIINLGCYAFGFLMWCIKRVPNYLASFACMCSFLVTKGCRAVCIHLSDFFRISSVTTVHYAYGSWYNMTRVWCTCSIWWCR